MNILSNWDFKKNQIMNALGHLLAAAPQSPEESQEYYNTVEHRKYYFNGSDWIPSDGLGATMTGTAIVEAINLSGSTIDDGNLSENVNNAITNSHIHSNKAILDNTTASFLSAHETKLSFITVTKSVNLDTMNDSVAANSSKVSNATHTGDVTGSTSLTIANDVVSNTKLANMATKTIKGNNAASTGDPKDLTVAEVNAMLGNVLTETANTTGFSIAGGTTSKTLTVNNNVTLSGTDGSALNIGSGGSLGTGAFAPAYTHPTGDGNLHVPATLTTNGDKFLKAGSTAGSLSWANAPVLSVNDKTGAVTLTATDVNLGNVTNNAQVKKSASSTNGNIPTWSGTTGDALGSGYAVETTLNGATTAIPRADAVKAYVDSVLSANDAMVFKGTIGTGGTVTALPTTYSAGWTYRVITAGTYAGDKCEIGDIIFAVIDRAGTGNVNTDWTAIQTNIDGAVIGPISSTNGNFPIFSGTTGKLIANSTYGPSSFAANNHEHSSYDRASAVLSGANVFSNIVVTDGIVTATATRTLTPADIEASPAGHTHAYASKYTTTFGDGSASSFLITHNLNSRDLVVSIRQTNSPYEIVLTDVELTTLNTATIRCGNPVPLTNQYTLTIVG